MADETKDAAPPEQIPFMQRLLDNPFLLLFLYERFVLPAGDHDIAIRLRDTTRDEGFDHVAARRISLTPEQSFAIDFRPVAGGFIFN